MKKPVSEASAWLKDAQEKQTKIVTDIVYTIFYCKAHEKTIHYLRNSESVEGESPCWDCWYDANKRKK